MFIGILANRKHALTGLFLALGIAAFLTVSFANSAYAEHEDFVGHEPPVCDVLEIDGPIEGKISGNTSSAVAELRATFNQFGCRITGELEILSPSFAGTGPFYGIVDGNFLRFTVTSETSDSPRDLNFSGLIDGNNISGQYSVPHTRLVGEWIMQVPNQGLVSQLVDLTDQVTDFEAVALIRELQSRLSELRLEREEISGELDHQVDVESNEIIHRWEQDIEDLKTDVEHEIDIQTRRIEREKRQVTLRLGRNTVVGELDRELETIVAEKWAFFNRESSLKEMYLNEDLDELENTKAAKIEGISQLIEDVEFELQQRLRQSGFTLTQVNSEHQDQQPQVTQIDMGEQNDVVFNVQDDNPMTPLEDQHGGSAEESGAEQNRGFFLNSESGALGDLGDSLDPTTLAVLGILITLAASGIQLVKGN